MTGGFIFFFLLFMLLNLRIGSQLLGSNVFYMRNEALDAGVGEFVKFWISLFGGPRWFGFVSFVLGALLFVTGQLLRSASVEVKNIIFYRLLLVIGIFVTVLGIIASPVFLFSVKVNYTVFYYIIFSLLSITGLIAFMVGGSYAFRSSKKVDEKEDPFGHLKRAFAQTTEKKDSEYGVNISYTFLDPNTFKSTSGYINIINQFRACQVLGTPGSGKSYAFFLPIMEQNIARWAMSMLIYDFKFPDLSEHAITCARLNEKAIVSKRGKMPAIKGIYFDNVVFSDRCNVLQPHLLKDFTMDAVNVAKTFMFALNKSWRDREGDFFVESAVNFIGAVIWLLKVYKDGKYCTLPHVIEFLSLSTLDMINCMIAVDDDSLKNVVKPFKEAKDDNVVEQLNGQIASVTIPISRFASPVIYWVLAPDDNIGEINLDINREDDFQFLCLGNSAERQQVNNLFFSLFVSQIFRLINKKNRVPINLVLDELVTLSFPKGTIDNIIATGRSNRIAALLGYQDLSQLKRDFGNETADALFKTVGNTFAGSVKDETAEKMSHRLGDIYVIKKEKSLSAEETVSYTFRKDRERAVPASIFSNMSQGEFAGEVADNFDDRLSTKIFYGQVNYTPPYKQVDSFPINKYWANLFTSSNINYRKFRAVPTEKLEKDENWIKAGEIVNERLKANKERVIRETAEMAKDLLSLYNKKFPKPEKPQRKTAHQL